MLPVQTMWFLALSTQWKGQTGSLDALQQVLMAARAGRAGGQEGGSDSLRQIDVHFCIFLTAIRVHLLDLSCPTYSATAPFIQTSAPISECGAVSYGMALQCAETAEVMNTQSARSLVRWMQMSWPFSRQELSWAVRDRVCPSLTDARRGRDPANQSRRYVGQKSVLRKGQGAKVLINTRQGRILTALLQLPLLLFFVALQRV